MQRFFDIITDGRLSAHRSKAIADFLKQYEGKEVCIEIKAGNRRSTKQNAFYWGCVIPEIKRMFEDAGQPVTPDDVHHFLKEHVAGMVRIIEIGGERKRIVETSTKLTKKEWEEYIEKIRAWGAPFGLDIPEPTPQQIDNYLFNKGE